MHSNEKKAAAIMKYRRSGIPHADQEENPVGQQKKTTVSRVSQLMPAASPANRSSGTGFSDRVASKKGYRESRQKNVSTTP
jgi:hypothetical protein